MKRVIMVRTIGPRNAGGALRAVANFGPAELWLVAPTRPSLLIHPEFMQMSHGVENIGERIRVVDRLEEALADCARSYAFSARARGSRDRLDWREEVDVAKAAAHAPDELTGFVFGSEENGLTVEETDLCQHVCFLGTSEEHRSINLAVSVGIVLSSLFEGRGTHMPEAGATLVDGKALAFLKEHLKDVLGGQVARGVSARRDIEASIERVFSRAPIEPRDARAWHMMMRALGSAKGPGDLGVEVPVKRARREQALDRARRKGVGDASGTPEVPGSQESPDSQGSPGSQGRDDA